MVDSIVHACPAILLASWALPPTSCRLVMFAGISPPLKKRPRTFGKRRGRDAGKGEDARFLVETRDSEHGTIMPQ
jgi:hypothetical protein